MQTTNRMRAQANPRYGTGMKKPAPAPTWGRVMADYTLRAFYSRQITAQERRTMLDMAQEIDEAQRAQGVAA